MTRNVWSEMFTPQDAGKYARFQLSFIAAGGLFAVATILIAGEFVAPLFGWVLMVATLALSVFAFWSYVVFLRGADELMRRIQLEGLALGFGAGAVFMPAWRLFERLGGPKLDSNDALLVMMFAWMLGQWLSFRRYVGAAEDES